MLNSDEAMLLKQELEAQKEDCDRRFDQGNKQFCEIMGKLDKLSESIEPVLDMQRDIIGVKRIGKGIQKFLLFVLSIPVIGTGIYGMVNWLIERLGH